MKIYKGTRTVAKGCRVVWYDVAEDAARRLKGNTTEPERNLEMRHDLRHHSDGFEWGYEGSGPAQLALALCADALKVPRRTKEPELGEELPSAEVLCRRTYQDVKRRLVTHFGVDWELSETVLLAAIEESRLG